MRDPTVADRTVFDAVEPDRAWHVTSRLRRRGRGLVAGRPFAMAERQPVEVNVRDVPLVRGVAPEDQQSRQDGRDDVCSPDRFALSRQVIEPALWPVEVPLARLVQRLEDVLDVIRGAALREVVRQAHARLALELGDPLDRVDRLEPQPTLDPVMERDELDVLRVPPQPEVTFLEAKAVLALEQVRHRLVLHVEQLFDLEESLLRKPRALRAPAVDPKLGEVPLAARDLGD